MELLTHDEIWHHLTVAKRLLAKLPDTLLRSSLPILAAPLTREDPDNLGSPIELTELEQYAFANLHAIHDAYVVLHLTEP